jgi:site-specific DNA recombinase
MPNTNGHGPKTAILYARVSTEEQARSGYSIRQQQERGRQWCVENGYTVLAEIVDAGYSGAYLERPGMDEVRDAVARGGVNLVWAQDRDRFSREPAYTYLLKREFEEYGTKIRSDGDRGDESPEGELTDGILDQLAKYERAKIAERSRRGKLRKAREGKAVSPVAKYGFRFNDTKTGLLICDEEMAVVEKIMRWAVEGWGTAKMQTRLHTEGILSPSGKPTWDRAVIQRVVCADQYRPHSPRELSGLLSPEVLDTLDLDKSYGIQWYNRNRATTRTVSEPDGNGGRRYKKRKTLQERPREEWLAIPVPASDRLSSELVNQARATMDANKGSERKHLARDWELRSVMRCSCGAVIRTKTTKPHGRTYHYYYCERRNKLRGMCDCKEKALQAHEIEPLIWSFVSDLLKDPARMAAGMERLIEHERDARRGDPEKEGRAWTEKIAECLNLRGAYQDQQAAGLMTIEELGSRLADLEEARRHAELELASLEHAREQVAELERDRDALLASYTKMVPEGLDALTGAERNQVYRMLRLQVTPTPEGFEVTGALRDVLRFETDENSSTVRNNPLA